MAAPLHIACPACKAAVGVTDIDRVVTCTFCKARSLVETDGFVQELWVEPACDRDQARRALQRSLTGRAFPPELLARSTPHSATLYLVPFHELRARRLGTMELGDHLRPRQGEALIRGTVAPAARETRVIFGDVHRVEPAVDLAGWALEHVALMSAQERARLKPVPFDGRAAAARGVVRQPTRSADRVLTELATDSRSASVVDRTVFAERRVRRIYYPVWRLRYRFAGRIYGAVVDGVTGEVISVRAPQNDGTRIKWLIATAMVISLFFGQITRWFWLAATWGMDIETNLGMAAVILYGFFFMVVVLFAAAGWHQFRYPGEVVMTGRDVEVVKVGAAGDGMDAPWIRRLGDALNTMMENMSKGANDRG